jgi:HK97 family phage major capsid protein
MTVHVQTKLQELNPFVQELASLSSLEHPSRTQNMRMTSLMSIISALKAGSSLAEVKSWEIDELRKAAGLSRLPASPTSCIGIENEREWRKFFKGEPVRPTYIPHPRETRANEAGSQSILSTEGPAGSTFVATQMHDRFLETMKQGDQVFEPWASNQIQTETGILMTVPVADDVSVQSVQVGETVQSNEVDVFAFGQVQLNSYSFRSKIVAVSLELLQDSNFSVGVLLERIFASRHMLGVGNAWMRGTGVASCTGLLTATVGSGAVPVIANGSSVNTGGAETGGNSIGTKDLCTLYSKLDPKMRPGAVWYMQDATLQNFAALLDKEGRPLFPNQLLGDGQEIYLLGHRVALSPSMPGVASGNNSVIFAQPNYFTTRTVPSATYVRKFWQNPTLVQFGLVGFESFFRTDSNLVSPNVNYLPAQYLQHHS